jgi:hypothetical protein
MTNLTIGNNFIAIIPKKNYIVCMAKKSKTHRGRFQAQGNGLEESE